MYCKWLRTIAGVYFPDSKSVGLDYSVLASNPIEAEMTVFHEAEHKILNTTTEYGLATSDLFTCIENVKNLSSENRSKIVNALYKSQLLVQEGFASLIEVLMYNRQFNKPTTIKWAKERFPKDYYDRFEKMKFVLDYSQKYRNYYINKIAHLALQTNIREDIVKYDLLSYPDKLIDYLEEGDNNPDLRLLRMIDALKINPGILNKEFEVICEAANIKFYRSLDANVVVDYLNYLQFKIGFEGKSFTVDDISEIKKPLEIFEETIDNLFISNLNMNLAENAIVEWKTEDFLHFSDQIEAVIVNRFEDDPNNEFYKTLTGNNANIGIIGFTKSGGKYITALDNKLLPLILSKNLSHATVIVKWGLYKPSNTHLTYLTETKYPDVVLYNNLTNLVENFQEYFSDNKKVNLVHIITGKDHPFQTLIFEDETNILHIVNTFGDKKLNSYLQNNSKNILVKTPSKDAIKEPKHLNNAFCVWMNFPWEYDIFQTLVGQDLVFRKQ